MWHGIGRNLFIARDQSASVYRSEVGGYDTVLFVHSTFGETGQAGVGY
jgi:hypothetical protein